MGDMTLSERSVAQTTAVVAAAATIVIADSWRSALLEIAAALTLAATRVRFAGYAAVGVLLIGAVIALGGQGPAHSVPDGRPKMAATAAHHRGPQAGRAEG
jgi:hypothetical protein